MGALRWLMAAGLWLAVSSAAADDRPMAVIDLPEWRAVLAQQPPAITVVDLWASWCVSCIERFPDMVEMAERYGDRGVDFLTLNLDDPEDQVGIDWANDFLAEQAAASMRHYHLAENLTESFEALDLVAIPVVLIHGRDGLERYRLTNDDPNDQFSEADIEQAVEVLLAE